MNTLTAVLQEVYKEFSLKGVISLYLWGSVIRDDYDEGRSDIDVLAIVEDSTDPNEQQNIKKFVSTYYPEIKNFKINFLYKDELDGGKSRTRFTEILPPGYTLLHVAYWKLIAGTEFKRSDFKVPEWSLDQAIDYNCGRVRRMSKDLDNLIEKNFQEYLPKACMMICYHLHKKEIGEHPYNPNTLLEHATDKTRDILPVLLKVKLEKYNPDAVRRAVPEMLAFVESVEKIIKEFEK